MRFWWKDQKVIQKEHEYPFVFESISRRGFFGCVIANPCSGIYHAQLGSRYRCG